MNTSKISKWLSEGKDNKAFTRLYRLFPKAEQYVLQNSGSRNEALDIFQEALIILHQKHQVDQTIQVEGFLLNTCRFLWQNELRKKKVRQGSSEDITKLTYSDDLGFFLEQEEKFRALEKVLMQISAKCRQIFKLFYIESLSMAMVAKRVGFKSVQSAKVQKYKCMEHARNLVLQNENHLKH